MPLQIQCLQEMGDVRAALRTAQDMDAQAKRRIQELTPQTSTAISDGLGGGTYAVESDPSVIVLVPDAKEAAAGLEKAYEAAVWAKVTIATLTTLTTGTGGHANKGNRAGNTGGKMTTRKKMRSREMRENTSGRENTNPARKVCSFRTSLWCVLLSYQSASCRGAAPTLQATAATSRTVNKYDHKQNTKKKPKGNEIKNNPST